MASVAFLGLGVMGYPMAGHLKKKGGHNVTVYNRTAAKPTNGSASMAAIWPKPPSEAAADKDFVFSCVGNDDDLREVTLGPARRIPVNEERLGLHRQHNRIRRSRARTRSGSIGARLRLSRRAGLRRSGGRGKRHAHRHGRRRAQGDFDRAKPVIESFARMVGLMGPVGCRPAYQDDQPDLASPALSRVWRKAFISARRPGSTSKRR